MPKQRLTQEKFILKCQEVHGDLYDLSQIIYITSKIKVTPICKIHGKWLARPDQFLIGSGCPICSQLIGNKKNQLTQSMYIKKCQEVHGDLYDLSQIIYNGGRQKITPICYQHGKWETQARGFMSGKGCPHCRNSKKVLLIKKILNLMNIKFTPEKRFDDCRRKLALPFDFYLPEYKVAIEYDGEQHYYPAKLWFGDEEKALSRLKYIQENDLIKTNYCLDKNIKLYRIKYTQSEEEILSLLADLIKSSRQDVPHSN